MFRTIFGALLIIVAMVATGMTQPRPHHGQANITCAMCHGDGNQFQPVATATCLTCHGDRASLIKKTEHLNKKVKEKNPVTGRVEVVTKNINPHSGHHDRGRLDCFECHREHKPSINLCAQCHDVARWMGRVP